MTSTMETPPPPYSQSPRPSRPVPEITILMLGSPGVGKSTFISALPHVRNGQLQRPDIANARSSAPSVSPHIQVPNPSSFLVRLFNRPYNIVLHRSDSTLFVDPFPDQIDFAILCYAVDSRESLYNCQFYWRKQFADRYERDLGLTVPVMLVGLKRDLRTDERRAVDGFANIAEAGGKEGRTTSATRKIGDEYICVMPEEGLKAAQEMRCDRYGECSAVTGELMWEVLEDITRTAALTTTERGGLSEGNCVVI